VSSSTRIASVDPLRAGVIETPLSNRLRDAFERSARRALLFDPAVALTGADLLATVDALASALEPAAPRGSRVGVLLPASAAQAAALLTTIVAGRVPVVLDPWTVPARLAETWRRCRLQALITSETHEAAVPGPVLRIDREARLLAVTRGETGEGEAAGPVPPPPPGTAIILSTSGSTGEPKSVLLPERGLLEVIDRLIDCFGLGAATVAGMTLPIHHTMALNTQLLPTLLAGGEAIFFDSGPGLGHTFRDLLGSRATFVALVSELLRPCLIEMERRGLPAAQNVTEMQLSGGSAHPEHLEIARQLFPHARLHKGYGLTEAIRVTMIDSRHPRFAEASAGFPLPGQQVEVRDERGRALAPGERGRICVRGANVMLGYDGEGAPPLESGGFLDTGDLGHFTEDGRLVVEGRRDGVFKSYGRRIAAAEIERAALRCPEVAAAKCIAVPCPVRGMKPLLFVEPSGPAGSDPRPAIEATLKRELEPYKVPREIVLLRSVPRSPAGKINRRALEALWNAGPDLADLGRGPLGCHFKALRSDLADLETAR
jgi:acyl-CoA synthetase (AMP-forming)/AMP-acid ligase II